MRISSISLALETDLGLRFAQLPGVAVARVDGLEDRAGRIAIADAGDGLDAARPPSTLHPAARERARPPAGAPSPARSSRHRSSSGSAVSRWVRCRLPRASIRSSTWCVTMSYAQPSEPRRDPVLLERVCSVKAETSEAGVTSVTDRPCARESSASTPPIAVVIVVVDDDRPRERSPGHDVVRRHHLGIASNRHWKRRRPADAIAPPVRARRDRHMFDAELRDEIDRHLALEIDHTFASCRSASSANRGRASRCPDPAGGFRSAPARPYRRPFSASTTS